MKSFPIPRLDRSPLLRQMLGRYCRLQPGAIWRDPRGRHSVGCLDATAQGQIESLMGPLKATLAIQDPPYNLAAFDARGLNEYIAWCSGWVQTTRTALAEHSSLYVWLGADQTAGFQPLPDFMIMMRQFEFRPRSFITMRNQRGYGTQKNWMAVRQELLYYARGNPIFHPEAEYTDIPKILRGYYKRVNGELTENLQRSRSLTIRAGNVWVDVQQVFYRLEENVNGCYAQKPLKACERIIRASSNPGDLIVDFFAHSGSTLLAAEILERRCYTVDVDPVYCEIAIRRLERYRSCGRLGWQDGNPFEQDIADSRELREMLGAGLNASEPEVGQMQLALDE